MFKIFVLGLNNIDIELLFGIMVYKFYNNFHPLLDIFYRLRDL